MGEEIRHSLHLDVSQPEQALRDVADAAEDLGRDGTVAGARLSGALKQDADAAKAAAVEIEKVKKAAQMSEALAQNREYIAALKQRQAASRALRAQVDGERAAMRKAAAEARDAARAAAKAASEESRMASRALAEQAKAARAAALAQRQAQREAAKNHKDLQGQLEGVKKSLGIGALNAARELIGAVSTMTRGMYELAKAGADADQTRAFDAMDRAIGRATTSVQGLAANIAADGGVLSVFTRQIESAENVLSKLEKATAKAKGTAEKGGREWYDYGLDLLSLGNPINAMSAAADYGSDRLNDLRGTTAKAKDVALSYTEALGSQRIALEQAATAQIMATLAMIDSYEITKSYADTGGRGLITSADKQVNNFSETLKGSPSAIQLAAYNLNKPPGKGSRGPRPDFMTDADWSALGGAAGMGFGEINPLTHGADRGVLATERFWPGYSAERRASGAVAGLDVGASFSRGMKTAGEPSGKDIVKAQKKAAAEVREAWVGAAEGIGDSFATGFASVITGTGSFREQFAGMFADLTDNVLGAIATMSKAEAALQAGFPWAAIAITFAGKVFTNALRNLAGRGGGGGAGSGPSVSGAAARVAERDARRGQATGDVKVEVHMHGTVRSDHLARETGKHAARALQLRGRTNFVGA